MTSPNYARSTSLELGADWLAIMRIWPASPSTSPSEGEQIQGSNATLILAVRFCSNRACAANVLTSLTVQELAPICGAAAGLWLMEFRRRSDMACPSAPATASGAYSCAPSKLHRATAGSSRTGSERFRKQGLAVHRRGAAIDRAEAVKGSESGARDRFRARAPVAPCAPPDQAPSMALVFAARGITRISRPRCIFGPSIGIVQRFENRQPYSLKNEARRG